MKELSIEEKAKRYDEAIERAKKELPSCGNGRTKMLERIFPSLKESEDERIRKALINGFNKLDKSAVWYNGITNGQILAWLERQGKNSMGISEATKQELEDNLNKALEKETPESCNEFLDEQKPADETKLKIEEEKWYVCISQFCNCIEGRAYKATSDSRIMDDFGTEYDMHSDAYKYFRLWTIEDAKDGDILAYGNDIIIFKENNYNPKDQSGCMFVYCAFNKRGYWYEIGCINPTYYKPATKEQRDTLMKAMADAGYTFDFEKKELKKIEAEAEELTEQKITGWSKEDSPYYDDICEILINLICSETSNVNKDVVQEDLNWLNSLKNRYAWKPSDEQLKSLQEVIDAGHYTSYPYVLETLYEELKKLRGE